METQVLEVRADVLRSTVGILFDLRTALQIDVGNTGLLVVRGLRECHWLSDGSPATSLTSWNVIASSPDFSSGVFQVTLSFFPNARFRVSGISSTFYILDVPEIGDAPPDYGDGDGDVLRAGLPGWSSPYSIIQITSI
ncbi:hypothetical protein [Actinoalloteichus sp. GBA129-24]|uniref:hypothetical protein n=1 Tax=Actinoalloteichus sp. GBA129-24 TaxID=1612551 RepID=UPI0012F7EAE9|nr:hypothetical protein [Actinoalloteichus sp. GBA129-24]